jgi:hypothetical protein
MDQLAWNMGPSLAHRKRANVATCKPAAEPIPGSAICLRLVNPGGFDKTKPSAIFEVVHGPINSLRVPTKKSPAAKATGLCFRNWSD